MRHTESPRTHHVYCLIYPGAQILDVTGPLEVFSRTSRWLIDQSSRDLPAYEVSLVAAEAGPVVMSSGLRLLADYALGDELVPDTFLFPGGVGVTDILGESQVIESVAGIVDRFARVATICTGAYIIAEAGKLNGRKVTTHWGYTHDFLKRYPDVDLQEDQIYCRDDNLYSSGGVTAGIDMALAIIRNDHGKRTALSVAKELVLYLQRSGGQNQFSTALASQAEEDSPVHGAVEWISENFAKPIRVRDLADMAAMSPRNFRRRFVAETGFTPTRFLERVRVEKAMRLLEDTNLSIAQVARKCGLSSADVLRQAFNRVLGVSPMFYRMRFR